MRRGRLRLGKGADTALRVRPVRISAFMVAATCYEEVSKRASSRHALRYRAGRREDDDEEVPRRLVAKWLGTDVFETRQTGPSHGVCRCAKIRWGLSPVPFARGPSPDESRAMAGQRRLNRALLLAVLLLTPACVAVVAGDEFDAEDRRVRAHATIVFGTRSLIETTAVVPVL